MGEQRLFQTKAASESANLSAGRNDAMTRDQKRKVVTAVCLTDGSHCTRLIDHLGYISVAASFAERDSRESLPDVYLKRRSGKLKGQIERDLTAGHVVFDLLGGGVD